MFSQYLHYRHWFAFLKSLAWYPKRRLVPAVDKPLLVHQQSVYSYQVLKRISAFLQPRSVVVYPTISAHLPTIQPYSLLRNNEFRFRPLLWQLCKHRVRSCQTPWLQKCFASSAGLPHSSLEAPVSRSFANSPHKYPGAAASAKVKIPSKKTNPPLSECESVPRSCRAYDEPAEKPTGIPAAPPLPICITFNALPRLDVHSLLSNTSNSFDVQHNLHIYSEQQRKHFLVVLRIVEILLTTTGMVDTVSSTPIALRIICKSHITLEHLRSVFESAGFALDGPYFSLSSAYPLCDSQSISQPFDHENCSSVFSEASTKTLSWLEAASLHTQYETASFADDSLGETNPDRLELLQFLNFVNHLLDIQNTNSFGE